MFSFVTLGTNNLLKSQFFYDQLLQSINIINVVETERYIGYAKKDSLDKVEFYIMMPHNKKEASFGNGAMITFSVDSMERVSDFYDLALSIGATDEGLP